MSAATSPASGRVYGVKRVCAVWAFPRASYYATNPAAPAPAAPGKRGPKTALDDAARLALIAPHPTALRPPIATNRGFPRYRREAETVLRTDYDPADANDHGARSTKARGSKVAEKGRSTF